MVMQEKQSTSVSIDGPTADLEVHSGVVAASTAVSSSSVSPDTPTAHSTTLKSFVQQLNFEGYLSAFEGDGYDELEDLTDMTFDDIMDIKGMKKGHAKRIIKHVNKIKSE